MSSLWRLFQGQRLYKPYQILLLESFEAKSGQFLVQRQRSVQTCLVYYFDSNCKLVDRCCLATPNLEEFWRGAGRIVGKVLGIVHAHMERSQRVFILRRRVGGCWAHWNKRSWFRFRLRFDSRRKWQRLGPTDQKQTRQERFQVLWPGRHKSSSRRTARKGENQKQKAQ